MLVAFLSSSLRELFASTLSPLRSDFHAVKHMHPTICNFTTTTPTAGRSRLSRAETWFPQMARAMLKKDEVMLKRDELLQAGNERLERAWEKHEANQEEIKRLAHRLLATQEINMTLLRENGKFHCRGALEDIYCGLSNGNKIPNAWAIAYRNHPEFAKCVRKALGNAIKAGEAHEYIQKNLWTPLCNHVHRQATAEQMLEHGDALILPELPEKDKYLLKCMLESYNYRVIDAKAKTKLQTYITENFE